MTDKLRKLIDDLFHKGNLVIRLREPPCCLFCSTQDLQQKYNAAYAASNRYVVEDPSELDSEKISIMYEKDEISFKCGKCGAERVKAKYQNVPMWWVACKKCNTTHLSLIENECPVCSEISKMAKQTFLKTHGE